MKKKFFDVFLIIAGSALLAIATRSFLLPFQISSGGAGGVAQLLFFLFRVPLSVTVLAVNAVLLLLSWGKFSFLSFVKSVAGILLYSAFLSLFSFLPPLAGDLIVAAVFGGALAGFGVGLVLLSGGSTGGTDLLSLFLHNFFPHLSIAFLILTIDLFVIAISGFLLDSLSLIFYSILTLYVGSLTTDFVLTRGNFAKTLLIMTENPQSLAPVITEKIGRGITGIYTHRYFSACDKKALFLVVRARELPKVLRLVEEAEPGVFTIISDAKEVRGKGFREM